MSEMSDKKLQDEKKLEKKNDKKIADKGLTSDEYKRQQELKMKKQNRKDLLTVLAILSSVFVHALLIALLKGGEKMIRNFTGSSVAEAREIYNNTRNVLMGLGIISLIIMIVFIIQCIKEHKKNKRMKTERKAFIDYDRLEMAKIRVAKARLEAQKNGGKSSTKRDRLSKRLADMEWEDNEFLASQRNKKYQGMSEAEYRKMRQEEYERYMNMDFLDDDERQSMLDDWEMSDEEFDNEYEDYTRFERFKLFISEHILIIGIVAGVIILGIMAAIIIGILV